EMQQGGAPPRDRGTLRSPARGRVLFAAGAVLGVLLIVLLVTQLGGGSSHSNAGQSAATTATTAVKKHTRTTHHQTPKPAVPANAAEIPVAVLNGTETTGLAHHVSSELQQVGYSQAAALSGRPPGAGQTTVVEYTTGHRADAEGVARSLSVTHVL